MPLDDFDVHLKQLALEHYRRLYERTKNPRYGWYAYATCRELMQADPSVTFPDWVLTFFDAAEQAIADQQYYAEEEESSLAARLADALGFKRAGRGVHGNAFTHANLELRDRLLADRVRDEVRRGMSVEAAVGAVAERFGLKEPLIWNAWAAWKDFREDS